MANFENQRYFWPISSSESPGNLKAAADFLVMVINAEILCVPFFFDKVVPLVKSVGTKIEKCRYLVTNPGLCCTSTIVVFKSL